ncbi:glycerophosphoryl diester phosphodiesterase [Acidimicrobium ferrooxidans DSM 10331]|uniref:Glycerophosphoryl diester phosphodiesterase n=1 Tax=Acidimicrobium ferrooxidans (strain DSM 10331 / JCM 15462 / NBRC 103882 / ICP) TaxID=525909 RepID=C7M0H0_ACIFD|nr:glycerophosphodiester phosphodiesterase family protein [Acidimicrobium ferrooxidans]ACU54478.1 glycerophosphoryl diester phosphodiesterase [Acidimicrobium ferrooxidans DSM 10331]
MDGRSTPLIVAHRGGMGEACESTRESFASAAARGATGVELDVRKSADGVLVVHHDPTLDRTAGVALSIASATWEQLATIRLPCGTHEASLARLEEVLAVTEGLACSIDIKDDDGPSGDLEARVIATLTDAGALERCVVASFHRGVLERVRSRWPGVRTTAAPSEVAAWIAGSRQRRPPWRVLSVPRSYRGVPLLTERRVRDAHALGCEVWVWTINDVAEATFLDSLGVDAIITDVPGLLSRALGRSSRQARH